MSPRITFVLTLSLWASTVARSADTSPFRCPSYDGDYKTEGKVLRRNPRRATRTNKRQVEIAWDNGKQIFTDEPPYDEPLSGVRWFYCGYDPKLGLHLISKSDNSRFTGVLLNNRTGTLIPGGFRVLFSPDQNYYLTFEMQDGDVTELLKLYRKNGELLWSGHNGLTAEDSSLLATFRNLHWTTSNRVEAIVVPAGGAKRFVMTLALRDNGKWYWEPVPSKIDNFQVDPGQPRK